VVKCATNHLLSKFDANYTYPDLLIYLTDILSALSTLSDYQGHLYLHAFSSGKNTDSTPSLEFQQLSTVVDEQRDQC